MLKSFEIPLESYGSDLIVEIGADEDSLAVLYLSAKACGVLQLTFHEGIPTLREFIDHNLRFPECCLFFCARPWHMRGTAQREILGAAFLHDVVERPGVKRIEVGLMFLRRRSVTLKEALAPESIERMVHAALGWIFGEYGATVLWNLTPRQNRTSIKFSDRVGWSAKGVIPEFLSWRGHPEAAVLMTLAKEDYEHGSAKRREAKCESTSCA